MTCADLITHRGRSNVSRVVWNALEEAERLAGFRFVVTQGSCTGGAVEASGATHNGDGVVDLRTRDLTAQQKARQTWALRTVGFAYWPRFKSQGFAVDHGHGALKGVSGMDSSAIAQVRSFEAGRNGLRSNLRDTSVDPFKGVTWSRYLAAKRESEAAAQPNRDVTISAKAVQMAAQGKPMSGRWGTDAAQFMAFASPGSKANPGYNAIPWTTFWAWHKTPPGTRKAQLFSYAIRCVQAKARLRQDGVFGPVTARVLTARGWTITDL